MPVRQRSLRRRFSLQRIARAARIAAQRIAHAQVIVQRKASFDGDVSVCGGRSGGRFERPPIRDAEFTKRNVADALKCFRRSS